MQRGAAASGATESLRCRRVVLISGLGSGRLGDFLYVVDAPTLRRASCSRAMISQRGAFGRTLPPPGRSEAETFVFLTHVDVKMPRLL